MENFRKNLGSLFLLLAFFVFIAGCKKGDSSSVDPLEVFEFVDIPAGSFMMGSPNNEVDRDEDEGPMHEITLSAFKMSKTEVTQELWKSVMGSNPSYFKGKDLPVEKVSWNDCQDFIKKLNAKTGKKYRLPTEAEWEYACRAGTTTPFNTGNNLTTDQASCDGNGNVKGIYREKTMPVKSFAPNAWGLYDMHGNVWEWCSDWYNKDYYKLSVPNNPTGHSDGVGRVIRGGCWCCDTDLCRSANRSYATQGFRHGILGFRLVYE